MQIGQQVWCPRLKQKGQIIDQSVNGKGVPHWRVRFGILTMSLKEPELEPWNPLKLRQDQLWEELFYLCQEIQRRVAEVQDTLPDKNVTNLRSLDTTRTVFDRLVQCQHRLMETHLIQLELEDRS